MKVRLFFLIQLVVLVLTNIKAQSQSVETNLLIAAHDSMIGKYTQHGFPIIYTKKTPIPSEEIKLKVLNTDTIGKLYNNWIILTDSEKNKIVSHILSNSNHIWDDELIPNSKVIEIDSIWSIINEFKSEPWSKLAWNNNLRTSVFVFSKPCFIRNESIALVGFADICGAECGVVEVSFYGFQNNKWIKLKQFSGGV